MPDTQNIEATPTTEHDHESDVRASYDGSRWRAPLHQTRRAAAIEAAYILEAVRK
jgi:hypothetical protein